MSKRNETLCVHQLSDDDGYCYKCGALSYKTVIHIISFIIIQEITYNHINYFYTPELSPKILFTQMINNKQKIDKNILVNNLYKENRKAIIRTINMINTSLENSSQTFFLALYYMDLTFINPNFEEILKTYFKKNDNDLKIQINKKDLYMICLACLIIATKYNENDPHVPNIISFTNLLSYYTSDMYKYQIDDIRKAEVFVLKIIEYKLNYFSIYHYFSFFFTHGFLFNKIFEKEKIREQRMNKNEILEKIYIKSREIMNIFI